MNADTAAHYQPHQSSLWFACSDTGKHHFSSEKAAGSKVLATAFLFPWCSAAQSEEPSELEQWTETSLKTVLTAIITPKGKNGKRRRMNVLHKWWKLKASTKSWKKICNQNPTILNGHWKWSPKLSAWLKELRKSQHKWWDFYYCLLEANQIKCLVNKLQLFEWKDAQKSWSNQNRCQDITTCFANRALRKEDCTEMLSRKLWWNVTTVKYMRTEKISSRDCVMLLINCSLQSFYTCWEAYACGQKNIVLQRCTTEFLCSSEKVDVGSTQWYEKSVTDGYHLIATTWVPESR